MSDKLDGFKMGEYFISFPPGDFVKEDDQGTYVIVDIYKINKDNDGYTKVERDEISKDLEAQINEELNRMLLEAMNIWKEENGKQQISQED